MKWIKLFEAFETSDYYTKISGDRFGELLGDDWVNEMKFDNKISNRLSDMGWDCGRFPHNIYDPRREYNSLFISYVDKWEVRLPFEKGTKVEKRQEVRDARIYQLPDEYFILEIRPRYPQIAYLCDQFDGLVKCLEDMNITKKGKN